MRFDNWMDLSGHGLDLKVVRVPRGVDYFVVRNSAAGLSDGLGTEAHRNQLLQLGFRPPYPSYTPPGEGPPIHGLYTRQARFDADGSPRNGPIWQEMKRHFPKGKIVEFDLARDFIDQSAPATAARPADRDGSSQDGPTPGPTDPRHPGFKAEARRARGPARGKDPGLTGEIDDVLAGRIRAMAAAEGKDVSQFVSAALRLYAALPRQARDAVMGMGASPDEAAVDAMAAGMAEAIARHGADTAPEAEAPAGPRA